MERAATANVRMFGLLYSARREAGLPTALDVEVPPEGCPALDLAIALELDPSTIEGAFVNGTVYDVGHLVLPGDRVAFVPHGTPGPHRFFLGLYRAGHATESGPNGTDDERE